MAGPGVPDCRTVYHAVVRCSESSSGPRELFAAVPSHSIRSASRSGSRTPFWSLALSKPFSRLGAEGHLDLAGQVGEVGDGVPCREEADCGRPSNVSSTAFSAVGLRLGHGSRNGRHHRGRHDPASAAPAGVLPARADHGGSGAGDRGGLRDGLRQHQEAGLQVDLVLGDRRLEADLVQCHLKFPIGPACGLGPLTYPKVPVLHARAMALRMAPLRHQTW